MSIPSGECQCQDDPSAVNPAISLAITPLKGIAMETSQERCRSESRVSVVDDLKIPTTSDDAPIQQFSDEFPIVVRNANKSFWQRKTENAVLVNLNLTIPRGVIYGLLGPSGSGKTTLLKCIVGRLRLDKGLVMTLNQVPGTSQSDIPGPRLGYMPQEEALDGILSIKELLHYYGRILEVEEKTLKKKTKFLLEFLKLPSKNALFSTLSGGQKRRVSFAVALINDAELFILDEPTVGMDPILKESIWNYLFELVRGGKKTVVITTHYIEEARAANYVGMMFDGRLLANDSPERLISRFKKNTLEEVFLAVCTAQKNGSACQNDEIAYVGDESAPTSEMPLLSIAHCNGTMDDNLPKSADVPMLSTYRTKSLYELSNMEFPGHSQFVSTKHSDFKSYLPTIHWNKLIAITQRNFIQLFRYPGLFLLVMCLPSFQISMCSLALGQHVRSIQLGVVNEDNGHLAQKYLSFWDNRLIIQTNHSKWEDARWSAMSGRSSGAIHFSPNFTSSYLERLMKTPLVSQEALHNSMINVSLDGTNFVISEAIRYYLSTSFERFTMEVLSENNMNPNLGALPVRMEEPIFGKHRDPYNDFIMPAFLTASSFFAQLGLSIIALFLDKEGGKMERIFIAGVTSFEIIFGFLVLQVIVLLAQAVLMLIIALVILDLTNKGSLILVIALTVIQGICGITLGLLISATTSSFTTAAMIAVPIIILSAGIGGFFWPIEAMSSGVKTICEWMPFAVPANAMRHIMYNQWNLLHPEIQCAFCVTLGWTFLFLALAVISFRIRKEG